MAIEFVGYPYVTHVEQPDGSEKCFAAIVAAVGGTSLQSAHEALLAQGISEADGTTHPMGDESLEVGANRLKIERVLSPFDEQADTDMVIDQIEEQFIAVKAVALLHKKTVNPADRSYHWILLPGAYKDGDERLTTVVMDPLHKHFGYLRQPEMRKIIDRSLNYAGVYGYTLERQYSLSTD